MITYDLITGKEILIDKKEMEIELTPHFVLKSGDTMTGSLTMPAESFVGPSNTTGIYFKDNYVGIGTTTPAVSLDVKTDTGVIFRRAASANQYVQIQSTSVGNYISITPNGSKPTVIGNNYTTANLVGTSLTLQSGGTITGTTTPDLAGGELILKAGEGTGTGASTISFKTGTTRTTGLTQQTLSTKMTILGSGNVGIGTINPEYKITVSGTATTSYNAFAIQNENTVAGAKSQFDLRLQGDDNVMNTASQLVVGKEQLWTSTANTRDSYFAITTRLDNALAEKFRVTSSGVGRFTGTGTFSIGSDSGYNRLQTYDTAPTFRFLNTSDGYASLGVTQLSVGYASVAAPTKGAIIEGNVGIGTTAPASILQLNSNTANTRLTMFSSGSNLNSEIILGESNSAVGAGLWYDGTANAFKISTGGSGDIISTAANTRLTILRDTGNVGIGTTNPTTKLLINGDSASTTPTFNTYTPGNTADIASFSARAGLELISYQSDSASPYLKTSAIIANSDGTVPSELQFWTKTNGQASPAERLRIDTSGNVGIGTTAPTQKLDVLGNVKATQYMLSALNTAPSSASDTGTLGEIRITATAIYICVGVDEWKKADISTW